MVRGLHRMGGGEWGCGGVQKGKWVMWTMRLMRHDKLRHMGHFVSMKKEVY
jgi:hypothetical protein